MRYVFLILLLVLSYNVHAVEPLTLYLQTKITLNNKEIPDKSLYALLASKLKEKDIIIYNSQSLKGKHSAYISKKNKNVSSLLSRLDVDAVASYSLQCDDSGTILKTKMKTYPCKLSSEIYLKETGKIIASSQNSFNSMGPNHTVALQFAVNEQIPGIVSKDIATWYKDVIGSGTWSQELLVSGMRSSKEARDYLKQLKAFGEYSGVKQKQYTKELTTYLLTGMGKKRYETQKDKLSELFRIVYDGGQVIYAEVDRVKEILIDVPLYYVFRHADPQQHISQYEADIIASYSQNLPYFNISSIHKGRNRDSKPSLFWKIYEKNKKWISVLSLSSRKKKLVTVFEKGEDLFQTLQKTINVFDAVYRKAVSKKRVRSKLGIASYNTMEKESLRIKNISVKPLFPSLLPFYRKNGIGRLSIKNDSNHMVENVQLTYMIDSKVVGNTTISEIKKGVSHDLTLKPEIIPEKETYNQFSVSYTYKVNNRYFKGTYYLPVIIHNEHAISWEKPEHIVSFIPSYNKSLSTIVGEIFHSRPNSAGLNNIEGASGIFYWMKSFLSYIKDPDRRQFSGVDTIQFPIETIIRKGGDCDDFTVLFAALALQADIPVKLILFDDHILPAFDSGLLAGSEQLLNIPGSQFLRIDGAQYIPVETTALNGTFVQAWKKAAAILNSSAYKVIDVKDSWNNIPPREKNSHMKKKYTVNSQKMSAYISSDKIKKRSISQIRTKNHLSKSVKLYFTNKKKEGRALAVKMCRKKSGAACFNALLMGADISSRELSTLPPNVLAMLIKRYETLPGMDYSQQTGRKKNIKGKLEKAYNLNRDRSKRLVINKRKNQKKVKPKNMQQRSMNPFLFFWEELK